MNKIILTIALFWTIGLQADDKPIRVAVIGGLTMSGLWEQVSLAFEKKHGIKIELVETGNKPVLNTYTLQNPVDLITMHSSDTMANLVSYGYVEGLTPWIHNAQMLVFDKSNPAKLDQNDTLEVALGKIVTTKSLFVMYPSVGSFEVLHELKDQYAFHPKMLFTQKFTHFLDDVVSHKAYTLFGVIPYLMKKHRHADLQGIITNAPAMRRPYLSAIGTQERIGKERYANAKRLQAFLTSDEVQNIIRDFRLEGFTDIPVFFPVGTFNTKDIK